jgi:hypothetical protein
METLEECLLPLDWNLWMSGCWITPSKKKWLATLVRIHGIGLILYQFLKITQKFPIKISGDDLVYDIRLITENLFGILFIVMMWTRHNKFQDLLKPIYRFLNMEDLRQIRCLTTSLLIYKIFILIIARYTFKLYEALYNKRYGLADKLVFAYSFFAQLNYWNHLCVVLCVVYIQVIHKAEKNVIGFMIRRLNSPQKPQLNAHMTFCEMQKFLFVKESFIKTMSILPCMAFLYLFVKSVADVLWWNDNNDNDYGAHRIYPRINLGHLLLLVVETSYIAFLADKRCQESRMELDDLKTAIAMTRENLTEWVLVLDGIRESKSFAYQAWNVYNIDKSTLLAFVSSFVTFTVLFVKIIQSSSN